MRGMAKVLLLVSCAADSELTVLGSGTKKLRVRAVANVSVKKNDKWEEEPVWLELVFWADRGEKLAKVLKKGTNFYVEADMHNNNYEKDGVKHYTFQFNPNPNSLKLLPGGTKPVPASGGAGPDPEAPSASGSVDDVGGEFGSDDLPF